MAKKIAVFQHLAVEHPGIFRDFLNADDIRWQAFEIDEGVAFPDLKEFDALWVMGGPMDVWEEAQYPWLIHEKQAIRHAIVELDLPFLGVCLGHQLFADALGGKVEKSKLPEVGVEQVVLTEAGESHRIFEGISPELSCLQWHAAEVTSVPAGFRVLAKSHNCAVQALTRSPHQVSIQFHVEVTQQTVAEWGAVPAYAEALAINLGPGALESFDRCAREHMPMFNSTANKFYKNWKALAGF